MRNEIVVGLDNSASSKAALNWAAEQANSTGTVLRAVHVLDWPYGLSTVGFPAPLNYMDVRREEIEDSYREAIVCGVPGRIACFGLDLAVRQRGCRPYLG